MDPVDPPSVPASGGDQPASPVAARFDVWAADYEASALQDSFYAPVHRHVLHLAARIKPSPARMLDLGCGTGRLLRAAARRFPHADLLGVDISGGMLEQARAMSLERKRRMTFLQADAARLPLADAAFDIVTCTASSHHWPDPQPPLAQLRRVTAPDGLLILAHLPGIAPWDLRTATGIRRQEVRAGTSHLTALLADAGFRITKTVLSSECPVMPTTVVLCARPDTLPRRRQRIRRLRIAGGA